MLIGVEAGHLPCTWEAWVCAFLVPLCRGFLPSSETTVGRMPLPMPRRITPILRMLLRMQLQLPLRAKCLYQYRRCRPRSSCPRDIVQAQPSLQLCFGLRLLCSTAWLDPMACLSLVLLCHSSKPAPGFNMKAQLAVTKHQ